MKEDVDVKKNNQTPATAGFTMIPNSVLFSSEITSAELRVWAVLKSHCYGSNSASFVSVRKLASKLNQTPRAIYKMLRQLEHKGFVARSQQEKKRLFVPIEPKCMKSTEKTKEGTKVHTDEKSVNFCSQKCELLFTGLRTFVHSESEFSPSGVSGTVSDLKRLTDAACPDSVSEEYYLNNTIEEYPSLSTKSYNVISTKRAPSEPEAMEGEFSHVVRSREESQTETYTPTAKPISPIDDVVAFWKKAHTAKYKTRCILKTKEIANLSQMLDDGLTVQDIKTKIYLYFKDNLEAIPNAYHGVGLFAVRVNRYCAGDKVWSDYYGKLCDPEYANLPPIPRYNEEIAH